MSGRELFEANPDLISKDDDEGALDSSELKENQKLREEEEREGLSTPAVEVDENLFREVEEDIPDFEDDGESTIQEKGSGEKED